MIVNNIHILPKFEFICHLLSQAYPSCNIFCTYLFTHSQLEICFIIRSVIFHLQHIQFLALLFLEKHLQYFSTHREEQAFGHWVGMFSKTTNCMLFILPYWTWQFFQYICDINHGTFPYCKILSGGHCDLMKSASSSLCNMWIHCSANGTSMEILSLSDWHYYPLCCFVIWIFRLLRSTR